MTNKRKKGIQSQLWWQMPVIPATQKVEIRGSHFEASLGKSVRPYLKNKTKSKRT
jgi:hypothetical protein